MAFDSLTIGSLTFNSIGGGRYRLSTLGFSDPTNEVKLTPGRVSKAKDGVSTVYAGITRHLEKEVEVPGSDATKLAKASITVQIVVPHGFTVTETDGLLGDVSELATEAFLNRLLMGEF